VEGEPHIECAEYCPELEVCDLACVVRVVFCEKVDEVLIGVPEEPSDFVEQKNIILLLLFMCLIIIGCAIIIL
jgi:hypothetical protein